ncbi:abortive infection system antitoxin AbiGi family protein [Mucilaginibacter sp. FT3.2]|uniref:abortive infection system antitoxin AbiGi family protein n=1 Tax=Mucilaginibacter sp. FT3.2 TaxID=2723090 RepID=UPI0016202F29|nr:abortive infection system antitoxin AbiGi family protein [Mucilaginibacter sp. FT3.2]MBB6233042.1 hypothetical protein [Mucilaginibacter sp. FT3.2]
MAVSTNSIIHFTSELDNLLGILTEGFKVKYCLERLESHRRFLHMAVPMISFCDIPFSTFQNHISAYGSYGIGLSKDWAGYHGINPVLYLSKGSDINKLIFEFIETGLKKKTKADLNSMAFIKKNDCLCEKL